MLFKIFLTFWLTLGVLLAAQEVVSLRAQQDEQRIAGQVRPLVDDAAGVVEAYARGGVAAARDAATAYERTHGQPVDILDAERRSVFNKPLRPAQIEVARLADRASGTESTRAAFNLSEGVAARRFVGPAGERLTLVVGLPRSQALTLARRLPLSTPIRLACILLIGGVFCFALARHFSSPLGKVAQAANALAEGNLNARVGRDVAGRHDEIGLLARDFDRMAERLDALVAGQRRLLGDVSHELRSPLARLTVAAGLAKKLGPVESIEYFDRIDRETARLDHLIEQLLTLARIDRALDEERRGPVNVTEIVHEVVAEGDFEARAVGRSVSLVSADSVVLRGRADLLRSAVENIVRNGIRFTAPQTAVDVILRIIDGATRRAQLMIRDHGPGVPADVLIDLFKRFWRGDGPPSDGAGLGLAIAESVVNLHGGTIAAANAPDGGLVVTIELPLTGAAE